MIASGDQREYWDRIAPNAVFTLPLDVPRLRRFVDPTARVLDYGCGYGRQLAELRRLGYCDLAGVDASAAMVEQARKRLPGRFCVWVGFWQEPRVYVHKIKSVIHARI